MESDEKLTALKRNCTDLIYKTTKEATSRIMLLEERVLLFQRELQLVKEESFGMQQKLQQMVDSKISEAELRSLSQQKKIEELEAQLHEAEDIVYDLREELRKVQVEPGRESCSKEKEVSNLQDHNIAIPGELPEENIDVRLPESRNDSARISNTEVANINQNVDNITTNGFLRAHLTPAGDNSPNEDSSEMAQRLSPETDEPDMGFAETSDDEPEYVEATGVHDAIEEHEGLMGRMDLSEQGARSMESSEVPAYKTDTDDVGNQYVFINNLCDRLLNSKSTKSNVSSGIPCQPLNDRMIKHKFQRKRKRDLCRVSYENASIEKSSLKKTNGEKRNSNLETQKLSSVIEPSEDSGQIAEVVQQVEHTYTPPGALTRGRRRSLRALASVRVSARLRTPIGKSKNGNAAASNQNELGQDNDLVPPGFDPIEDVPLLHEAEVMHNSQRAEISPYESKKTKKGRGKNKLRNIAGLKAGEKLIVTFFQNRVVGKHYATFVRHLGMIVRDRTMCPLRVHSWTDIEEDKLELMWQAVIDKFDSDDMNDQRYHVLKHMRNLWNKWRAALHMNVKSKTLYEALKDVPAGVDKSDWEWLLKERFFTEKFKEASTRNSVNRSKSSMPSRTGSKPIREIIYELGGKDGNLPDMATIFFETHKKDNKLVEPETNEKYAKIQKLVQSDPSLTNIEVVERCFGPQRKSHAVGFGGGVTAKELKGRNSSKAALLDKVNAS